MKNQLHQQKTFMSKTEFPQNRKTNIIAKVLWNTSACFNQYRIIFNWKKKCKKLCLLTFWLLIWSKNESNVAANTERRRNRVNYLLYWNVNQPCSHWHLFHSVWLSKVFVPLFRLLNTFYTQKYQATKKYF